MQLDKMLVLISTALSHNKRILFASLALPACIMFSAVMSLQLRGIAIGFLTRDPNAICGNPYYAGFISQIGIFFWAAAAAICLFTYYILAKQSTKSEFPPLLLFAGLFTFVLALDDVFQMHEAVFPSIGIPEKLVLIIYMSMIVLFLVKFKNLILKTNFLLLLMALFFFGMSIIVDVFLLFQTIRHLLEDGFKLAGIVTWAFYFAEICALELTSQPR